MRFAILVLAGVALCGEAAAQKMTDAQLAEAQCVRDGVKQQGRAGDLAESYLNEAAAQAVHDRAIDAVKKASATCLGVASCVRAMLCSSSPPLPAGGN